MVPRILGRLRLEPDIGIDWGFTVHPSVIMDSDSMDHVAIPTIETEEPLVEVIPKLSKYVSPLILWCVTDQRCSFISLAVGEMAFSFEQMRYGSRGHRLRQLVHALAEDSHNPFIIVALM